MAVVQLPKLLSDLFIRIEVTNISFYKKVYCKEIQHMVSE